MKIQEVQAPAAAPKSKYDPAAFKIKKEIEAAVAAILKKHSKVDFTEWDVKDKGTSSTTMSDLKSLENKTYVSVDVKIKRG